MFTDYKKLEANIYNYSKWINECSPIILKEKFENALIISGFNIILFNEHYFNTKGYTCFWLLAESHLAIHTFPESKKTYLELSSCNKEKLEKFKTVIAT